MHLIFQKIINHLLWGVIHTRSVVLDSIWSPAPATSKISVKLLNEILAPAVVNKNVLTDIQVVLNFFMLGNSNEENINNKYQNPVKIKKKKKPNKANPWILLPVLKVKGWAADRESEKTCELHQHKFSSKGPEWVYIS